MSEDSCPDVVMAAVSAQYITRVTEFSAPVNGRQRILAADPRRFYLEFLTGGAFGTNGPIAPGPYPKFVGGPYTPTFPRIYKWRDAPLITSGEWWADTTAGATVVIIEQLYVWG